MKTPDGQEVYIDLLAALEDFRFQCGFTAASQEWLEQHPGDDGDNLPDARFEEEFERLNRYIQAWWKDYKQNWRNFLPLPPVPPETMRTKDGQEVHIDLLTACAQFRLRCGITAAIQGWLVEHPDQKTKGDGRNLPDARFERELECLIWYIREWWQDYKQNWRKFLPTPPDDPPRK